MVEKVANEWDGENAADGEGQVKEVVDLDGAIRRAEKGFVLRADGCDEVVYTRHLDDCVCLVSD